MYTGDPSIPTQWSECSCENIPGDRRFIIASNDFTLAASGTQHIVYAMVTTNPDTPNSCPGTSFDSIKTYADTAWSNYFNPPPLAVPNILPGGSVNIYPNPVHDLLYIQTTGTAAGEEYITIYNSIGQVMNVAIAKNGQKDEVDVRDLPPGLYNVLFRKGNLQKTAKFVKE